jgi:1-acyl-sn-glycerol-3-phosphate acyltransferase
MNTTGTTGRSYSPSWRLISVIVLRLLVPALLRNKWGGRGNVPRRGGVILAVNHLTYLDWAPDGVFLHACGRYPVFMIKASAFELKGIGGFLRKAGQLPVHRGSHNAGLVLSDAEKRLAEGAAVVFYPEGTTTHDPAGWPMAARTGVARLALATGVPVIPVAHWGTLDIVPYRGKVPRLFPRKTVHIEAGRPVDLSPWAGQQDDAKALHAATDAIMAQVTELVGQLRGETPPPVPYDPTKPATAGPESMTRPLPEAPPG